MHKSNPYMTNFSFDIIAKDKKSRARAGIIHTDHGTIETPYLIPVATRAHIISLSQADIKRLNVQALLANTYHLHFKPGDTEIKKQGGLHKHMKFNKPIFTDSGGFQVFSLGQGRVSGARKIGFFPGERTTPEEPDTSYVRITDEGVWFTSTYDNTSEQFIGPKESMHIQSNLGADIIMAFDECTANSHDYAYTKTSLARTHRWEHESLKHHNPKQALYGIVQGSTFKDLRIESAKYINSLPFDGIAIGGSLGKTKESMYEVLDYLIPELDDRPRHMLGIGFVNDLFECVERGLDTFDCVNATRIARHGNLYVSPRAGGTQKNKFTITIDKPSFEKDKKPIDSVCTCSTCQTHTRAQLRTLLKAYKQTKASDIIAANKIKATYDRLATIHNLHFMQNLSRLIRESIIAGTFHKLKKQWLH